MIEFTAKLADIPVCIRGNHPSLRRFLQDYLTEEAPELTVEISQEDIDRERETEARNRARNGEEVQEWSDAFLERMAVYRNLAEQMIDRDVLLFHGSVIAVDGQAYLFTAKSGTGKSTHTRLWREAFGERAVMINDDKPLLRIGEKEVRAYGTPWNGKHRLSANLSAPLKAVCILTRDAANHIEPVTLREAYPALFQQCYRPEDGLRMAKQMSLLERMGRTVKLFRLGCNMDPEAALVSYWGMQEDS